MQRQQNTSMRHPMKSVQDHALQNTPPIKITNTQHPVLGASTTQLFMNLAGALKLNEGDEIILSKMEHETNVKPWLAMAGRLKLTIKWWVSEKPALKLTPENLKPLLSEKTKFVACTHVSNILGTIHDVKAIADAVHEVGALLCVDGVSYAPHRQVDVKAFGVDFYAFSWYKVLFSVASFTSFDCFPLECFVDRILGLRPTHGSTLCQQCGPEIRPTHEPLLQPHKNP